MCVCGCICVFRAAKERRKPDRVVFECQERAYWVVHRPPVRTHTPTHTRTPSDRCQNSPEVAAASLQPERDENSSSLPGFPIISTHDASLLLHVQLKEKVTD